MTNQLRAAAACAALGAALLASGAHAQTAPDPSAMPPSAGTSMPGMTTPSAPMAGGVGAQLNDTDRLFMLRAAQGDMGEIKTSQIALKKTKDSGVMQVAQTLISGHSQSLKEGMGLAELQGLTPPKDPGTSNMAIAMQLESASGKSFDKKFMADQTEAHENTIALYNMELAQGQDPQVKAFAAKYLPGIEGHTQLIYQVAKQVSAPDAAMRPAMPPSVPGYAPSMAPVTADAPATPSAMSPGMSPGAMSPGTDTSGAMSPGTTTTPGAMSPGTTTTPGAMSPGTAMPGMTPGTAAPGMTPGTAAPGTTTPGTGTPGTTTPGAAAPGTAAP